jgi:hypothetical protein
MCMYHIHACMHVDRNLKKSLFSNHPSASPETKLPIWRQRRGNVLLGQGLHKVTDVYEAAVSSDQHMKTKKLKENKHRSHYIHHKHYEIWTAEPQLNPWQVTNQLSYTTVHRASFQKIYRYGKPLYKFCSTWCHGCDVIYTNIILSQDVPV